MIQKNFPHLLVLLLSLLSSSLLVDWKLKRGFWQQQPQGPNAASNENAEASPSSLQPENSSKLQNPSSGGLASPYPDACTDDVTSLCFEKESDLAKDACLHDRFDSVSPACRLELQKIQDSFKPCQRDIEKHCPSAKFGGGRMIACLRLKQKYLSDSCKKRIGVRQ